MVGSLLTKWAIRLSLALYVIYLAGWLWRPKPCWPRRARRIWTLSCVLFDVHVACAFHFHHHWSHAAAWRHTAERTEELLGFSFGDGIFFSYVFLGLWLFDVIWLWTAPSAVTGINVSAADGSRAGSSPVDATLVPQTAIKPGQTPWWRVLVHIFLFFIIVNGAIVFEAGPTRWGGIAALLALAVFAARRVYNRDAVAKTNCPVEGQAACSVEG